MGNPFGPGFSMYARYWGLQASPFAHQVDPRWFVETPQHEEALARLLYLAEEHRRCGILLGPAGTGKSLLLQVMARQLRKIPSQIIPVDLLGLTGPECLWQLVTACGHACRESANPAWLWRRLRDHLEGNWSGRVATVFLLDHLERASTDCIPILTRLVHLTASFSLGTTTVITLRRENAAHYVSLLREISELRIELSPFELQDTRDYVHSLLQTAGAERELFEQEAIDRIHLLAGGNPREVSRLCDLALLTGMSAGAKVLTEAHIDSAAEDHPLNGWEVPHSLFSTTSLR